MNATLHQVKEFVRHPYAWPGGYPCYAVTTDGAALCDTCVRSEFRQIVWDHINKCHTGWHIAGIHINYEDPDLYCDHCSKRIESAYADK